MRHILRNAIFLLAIILITASAIFPVEKQLRLGKDLQGGVSLIYSVQIRPGDNAGDVLSRTIEVLKQRVDPDNMMDISMTAQGQDRIEITMPLPNDRVRGLRKAFDDALATIQSRNVNGEDVDALVRASSEDRTAILDRLSAGDQAIRDRLQLAADIFDEAQSSREELRVAEAEGRPESELDAIVVRIANAELGYERAREAVTRATLSPDDVRQALSLSNRERRITGDAGETVTIPSPRQRAIDRIREQYPDAKAQLDGILAAYAAYESERTTLDDPADLKRLLRGAGVLSFRITCDLDEHPEEARLRTELARVGPRNARAVDAGWYRINQIENWYNSAAELRAMEANPAAYFASRGFVAEVYDGEYYFLAWNTRSTRLTQEDGAWGIADAGQTSDEIGKPAIRFEMDPRGSSRLGELTGANIGKKMAILLDDEIYTAPVLNARISRNGIITGTFTQQEITYIVRVMTAGSLSARLSPDPISESTLGPELGADNLRQGLSAGKISLIFVGAFMVIYYFACGGIALIGLLCTATIIIGAMALNRAAFTLPGIAGIILTFGMAVDANVLIFERIREELLRGEDMRAAVKLGHEKAFSSIFDGNVTNLIVCIVLAYTGTPEIRGFAITLGIGVVATLISALLITRTIFDALVQYGGWRRTSMLPMVIKPIDRLLNPNVDWIKIRGFFIAFSAIYIALGLSMVFLRGEKMLDTEFRGGTQLTIRMKADESTDGQTRLMLTRAEVEERVRAIGEAAGPSSSLAQLRSPDVLPINAQVDGITSDTFIIRTTITDQNAVVESVSNAFADVLDVQPSLSFERDDEMNQLTAPLYPIVSPRLGDNIDEPRVLDDVTQFLGGVAIVLKNIEPPARIEDITDRLESMRGQPDFSDTSSRARTVRLLEGTPDAARSIAVIVRDPATSYFEGEEQWGSAVAMREWRLVTEALTAPSTLAEVRSFSPAVADSFRAKAVAAVLLSMLLITIYIWVRFGSLLYSAAAVACLLHDVLICIGLVAVAEVLWDIESLQPFLQSIGIMSFKIDLNMIAALLTIIGYSLNDTIVIMDRIRENRGKVSYATRAAINAAINQTLSRTVITSGTTLMAVLILYMFGGTGVRAFAFTMLVGILFGSYSSIAVGAPIVWSKKHDKAYKPAPDSPTT